MITKKNILKWNKEFLTKIDNKEHSLILKCSDCHEGNYCYTIPYLGLNLCEYCYLAKKINEGNLTLF